MDLLIQSDLEVANVWLGQLRSEIYEEAIAKSEVYNFDFLTESPLGIGNCRFQWSSPLQVGQDKLSRVSLHSSMRSSISTLATDTETAEDIPDISNLYIRHQKDTDSARSFNQQKSYSTDYL